MNVSRIAAAIAALAVAAVVLTASADDPTIAELLAYAEVDVPTLPAELRNLRVSSGAEWKSQTEYVYAGWTASNDRLSTLHVLKVDRRTAAWRHATYTDDIGTTPELAMGSVLSIEPAGRLYAITMHLNPSATSVWLLNPDLSRAYALYGLIRQRLPNGLILYGHNQVHFAPTHYEEMSVFDPQSGMSRQVYPPSRVDPVRRQFTERVRQRWAALGEAWMREHNHHGDPSLFDNATRSGVEVSWPNGLAFRVVYDDTRWDREHDSITEHVMVTCDRLARLDSVACRETPFEAWKRRFPGLDDGALVKQAAARPRLITP